MNDDYRNTKYCPKLENIIAKKLSLESSIRQNNPKTKILYNRIHGKDSTYFTVFSEIYNHKCAYCGASMLFTDKRLFEVDHFICESSYGKDTASKAEAGRLSNLVLACYTCNRGKKDFLIKDDYCHVLNPNDDSIAKVFYRDDEYYIQIQDEYKSDAIIKDFYDKLKLGYQTRRLDYLLLEMRGLLVKFKSEELKDKLKSAMAILIEKKNCTYCN